MSTLCTQENKKPKEKIHYVLTTGKNLRSCQSTPCFSGLFSAFVLLHFNATKQHRKKSKQIIKEVPADKLCAVSFTFHLQKLDLNTSVNQTCKNATSFHTVYRYK